MGCESVSMDRCECEKNNLHRDRYLPGRLALAVVRRDAKLKLGADTMSDLRDSIAKLLEFPGPPPDRRENVQIFRNYNAGMAENLRLKPVLMALLSVAESADGYLTWSEGERRYVGNTPLAQAMTALRNLSDKGEGK